MQIISYYIDKQSNCLWNAIYYKLTITNDNSHVFKKDLADKQSAKTRI